MTVREAFQTILFAITEDCRNNDGKIDTAAIRMICNEQIEAAQPIERLFARLHLVDPNFNHYARPVAQASESYRPLARAWALLSQQQQEAILKTWIEVP